MAEAYSLVITFLIVVISASVEGITHAILWSGKKVNAFKWNEHRVFVIQRVVFGVALMFTASWAGLIAALFAYPFFHNGFYYTYRDKIDGSYPKRFWADSISSSAKVNFSVSLRSALAIGGAVLLIFALIKL